MAVDADTAELTPAAEQDDDRTVIDDGVGSAEPPARRRFGWARTGLALCTAIAALVAVGGWLGYQVYQSHLKQEQTNAFLDAARQGALNLTTVSFSEVDSDVARILDSSTGSFRDDFQKRSQPFIDVVKQSRSQTKGTIAAAGVELANGDRAQVLVAVTVATTNTAATEQEPRSWRMRMTVEKTQAGPKVSNVEFVP